MISVFIFGSCVSRDAIEMSRSSFKIVDYYARSSFYSLGGKPASYNSDFVEKITSEFQKRMVKRDISKSLFLSELSERIDLILVDFIDERCGLIMAEDGSVATLSRELATIIEGKVSYKKINNRDESYYKGLEKGFLDFLAFFNAYKDRIRVIKTYWASHDNRGKPLTRPSAKAIELQNRKLEKIYRMVSNYLDQSQFINIPETAFVIDSEHKWGAAPFHYTREFYDYVVSTIVGQIGQ